jgi:hypothetical protein
VPAHKKPDKPRQFSVGNSVKVNLHSGRLVDAMIKAVIDRTDGRHYQVDFGHEQTALIQDWQVVEKQVMPPHPRYRKTCRCGHAKTIHQGAVRLTQRMRAFCNFPKCKCRDYRPVRVERGARR